MTTRGETVLREFEALLDKAIANAVIVESDAVLIKDLVEHVAQARAYKVIQAEAKMHRQEGRREMANEFQEYLEKYGDQEMIDWVEKHV